MEAASDLHKAECGCGNADDRETTVGEGGNTAAAAPATTSSIPSVTFGEYVPIGKEKPTNFINEQQALADALGLGCRNTGDLNLEAVLLETSGGKLFHCMGDMHPLLAATHYCFSQHLPLVLSPDIIWLTIAQGLSQHINANSEKLRYRFVEHDGTLKLTVRRDEFVLGGSDNDWMGVFKEFSSQIREHIGGKTHSMLVPSFTTTTPVSAAAANIVLMEAMKTYFEFEVMTLCDIPQFTILGSVADWEGIRQRVRSFLDIDKDLEWWVEPLVSVLDEFILAVKGKETSSFWKSWYKYMGRSGGNVISGAILALFPYDKHGKRGSCVDYRALSRGGDPFMPTGAKQDCFPLAISNASFTWRYYDQTLKMSFLAGLMGVSYEEKSGVRPAIGWGVLHGDGKPDRPDHAGRRRY